MAKITNIPKKIHIQLDYNNELEYEESASFEDWAEDATWCSERLTRTDVPFYSLEELERKIRDAFEAGWRMSMNRGAGECKELLENYVTLALLDE